jgi:hypothetical protein
MVKNRVRTLILVLMLAGISIILARTYKSYRLKEDILNQKKEALASLLGVKVEDYPDFPAQYFYTVIRPGTSLSDVHTIIIGYEQVLNCFGTDEVYYYFSLDDQEATRFLISFDAQGRYAEMMEEEQGATTLPGAGTCQPGLLEE